MLSGERRTNKANGRPTTIKVIPQANAVGRQPYACTAIDRNGVKIKPPMPMEPLISAIAIVRWRMNQVLAINIGASMKPA